MIEKWACTKLPCVYCYLPQGGFPHVRSSIFNFEQEFENSSFLLLFNCQILLIFIFQERSKKFVFFRFDWGQVLLGCFQGLCCGFSIRDLIVLIEPDLVEGFL